MSARVRRASLFDAGIIGVAVTYGLLLVVAGMAGLFGIPLTIVVLLSLWRYCYTLLRAFAQDCGRAPLPDVESMNPVGDWAPLLHAALFMLSIFLLVPVLIANAEGSTEIVVAAAIGITGIVAFPASAGVLGVTGNLVAAMNPVSIVTVIGVLRGTYVKLIAGLGVLLFLSGVLRSFVYAGGGFLGSFLGETVGNWAQLAAYALIGRAIADHGDEFDLTGEAERMAEQDDRDRNRAWQAPLDRAYASIRSGFVGQGYRQIRELAESEGESLDIYAWLFERMRHWEDRQHAVAIAPRFIERLLAAGRLHEALDLSDQCRRMPGTRFELAAPARAKLVEYARSVNRHRSADALEELGDRSADPFAAEQR